MPSPQTPRRGDLGTVSVSGLYIPFEWRQGTGPGEGARMLRGDLCLEDAGVHPVACPRRGSVSCRDVQRWPGLSSLVPDRRVNAQVPIREPGMEGR